MCRNSLSLLSLLAVGVSVTLALGNEPADPDPASLQYARRGTTLLLRKTERPALIEHLAREVEPVELAPRDLLLLDAYLAANSRPRRLYRDGFYSDRIATRGVEYDDPANRTLVGSRNVNHDEWQRLRTHLLFNRAMLAAKGPPNDAARR